MVLFFSLGCSSFENSDLLETSFFEEIDDYFNDKKFDLSLHPDYSKKVTDIEQNNIREVINDLTRDPIYAIYVFKRGNTFFSVAILKDHDNSIIYFYLKKEQSTNEWIVLSVHLVLPDDMEPCICYPALLKERLGAD